MAVENEAILNAMASGFQEGGSGAVSVNGKAYAVGLIWETFAPTQKGEPLARAAAKKHKADLFCVRAETGQYGLASKATGHKEGMLPLAALLSDTLEGAWIGVFEVDGGYYFAASRDDQILAGCERLIADKQDAWDAFAELFFGSTWNQAFAPADWGIDGTKPSILDEVLMGVSTKTKLKSASQVGTIIKLGGLVLLLFGGMFGYQQYEQYQLELAQEAEALAYEELTAPEPAPPPPPPPLPWEGRRVGVPTLSTCVDAIMAAELDVAGWAPESLTCAEGSVVLALKRDGGTINWIGDALNREGFKPQVVPVGDDAAVTWEHTDVEKLPRDVRTARMVDVRRYLLSQFDEVFHNVVMSPVEGTAFYDGLAFSFQTSHDPKEFTRILEPIPALLITNVRLDLASWTWTIEGNVYEELPQPAPGDARPVR